MINRSLVVALVSVVLLLLNGCFDDSMASAAVSEKTLADWVTKFMNDKYYCSDGCKDFVKTCTKSNVVSSADKLNGVSESATIGFTYVVYINTTKKFYDEKILVVFHKVNGVWKESEIGRNVIDIKKCY